MTDKSYNLIPKKGSMTESPVLGEMSPQPNQTTTTPPGANSPSAARANKTYLQQPSSSPDSNTDKDYLADGCVVS